MNLHERPLYRPYMRLFLLLPLLAAMGCNSAPGIAVGHSSSAARVTAPDSAGIDTAYYRLKLQGGPQHYPLVKTTCVNSRLAVYAAYRKATSDSARQLALDEARLTLTHLLLHRIFPYWYGTGWAFEGYTDVPRQGQIACGYFVSTTLRHAGFNLNRYRLAQKSPVHEALSLQMTDSITELHGSTPAALKNHFMQHKKDGLYFAGLSAHVGYLLKHKNELFFIHSNYIGSTGVSIEKALYSEALAASSHCYIADITHNNRLVRLWLTGEPLPLR